MIPSFDRFVAMDWSGSKSRRYTGISIAVCDAGRGAPKLIAPTGGTWSRTAVADWLVKEVGLGRRVLAGFDFGFSFPFEDGIGYLAGRMAGATDVFALWDQIDCLSQGDPDFGCAGMVAAHAGLFWTEGPRPADWVERRRLAERACGAATRTYPESLYKLLHSKQVGKASMTGIRVLNDVRRRQAGRFSIWPFETPAASVAVEIYPTLFRKQALGSTAKIRRRADLNQALRTFDAQPTPGDPADLLTDHDTDALLSAAALRYIAPTAEFWVRPSDLRVLREGWIFGVAGVGWDP
jgi:hypothetical protein